jgi:hypothetical protein
LELIEIETIDLRLAHTRHRDGAAEKRLQSSIQERGILDPLTVVRHAGGSSSILLDGFKRYHCAVKLGVTMVPVEYIGDDVIVGILTLLRRHEFRGVSTMEQAALIEELHKQYGMSIYDIAVSLGRSPSWVSMRLGMLDELSSLVRGKIMSGAFPARAYLYGLKGFTRVNKIPMEDVDVCVKALSGKHLSTRDLFILSRAYFNGGESIRRLIIDGDVHRALRVLKSDTAAPDWEMSVTERTFLEYLMDASAAINHVLDHARKLEMMTADFSNHVNLWCSSIVNSMQPFQAIITEFYEKTRPAVRGADAVPSGTKQASDCAVAPH